VSFFSIAIEHGNAVPKINIHPNPSVQPSTSARIRKATGPTDRQPCRRSRSYGFAIAIA
jgi:hypothetical protein